MTKTLFLFFLLISIIVQAAETNKKPIHKVQKAAVRQENIEDSLNKTVDEGEDPSREIASTKAKAAEHTKKAKSWKFSEEDSLHGKKRRQERPEERLVVPDLGP